MTKQVNKPSGIDAFITEEDSGSNDSFEEAQGDFKSGSLQGAEIDASKLIDLELINLLKYCHNLSE